MSIDLHRKRAYYLAHQDTLAQLYDGQFVVIKRRGKQKRSERDGKSETPSLPIGPIGRKPARSKAFGRLRSKSVPSRRHAR